MVAPARLEPTREELEALSAKYHALVELRRLRDGATPAPAAGEPAFDAREALRALARRFPGALRELDTLGREELERRCEAAARAAASGITEGAWMAWVLAFHRLMGAALLVKGGAPRRGQAPLDEATMAALATQASARAELPIDVETARRLARPPQGRLLPIVLGLLAAAFGVPARRLAETLFPTRRPSPYTLG